MLRKFFRTIAGELGHYVLQNHRSLWFKLKAMEHLDISQDERFMKIHIDLQEEREGLQTLRDRYNIYQIAQNARQLAGDFAEVGVYRGGSAKLLCELKEDRDLWLFDTFEGLPEVHPDKDKGFGAGQFSQTSAAQVAHYLRNYPNVRIVPGLFPASAAGTGAEDRTFAFVHLDVDIYDSTLEALKFFWPRMRKNGAILSHDYNLVIQPAVKQAFRDYFESKGTPVIPLWDNQCVVVKDN